MVQVDGRRFGLAAGIVKPPSQEELWDWMWATGYATRERDPDPSFGSLWPGAQYLALWLRPEDVKGRSVLEVGCGIGLCGLVAATLGARTATLVDREPLALHMAMSTAALNGLEVNARVADVASLEGIEDVDLVLASDVLYDSADTARRFAAFLQRTLEPRGGRAVVADPSTGRAVGARDAFVSEAVERGADVALESFEPIHDLPEPTLRITLRW